MIVIKNSKELKKLVNKDGDLIYPGEDLRIEFQPTRQELRDIYCQNLYLENDIQKFNFNGEDFNGGNFNGGNFDGGDFNGGDFNGGDFNGGNFNGWNFNGGDFDGGDFNGWNFNGKKISYYAFFISYKNIKCTSWEKRRDNALDPICLDGRLEIVNEECTHTNCQQNYCPNCGYKLT